MPMRATPQRRLGPGLALALAMGPFVFALADGSPFTGQPLTFDGKVVPLAGLLEKTSARLDADAAPHWLVLVADDGKIYPLLKDSGSRMFFKDPTLLNRSMRLTARRYGDSNLLQVVQVHSLVKGQPHEVFYWCDICAIKRYEKMVCECCGGPLEIREVPTGSR